MADHILMDSKQMRDDVVDKSQAARGAHRVRHFLQGGLTRVFNPFVLGHAGSRRLFKYAVIHHQGRRSGRSYATPVSARPTPDGFVVPMAFGERADWVRNVQAAGGCVIEWEGKEYTLTEPEVVDLAAVRSAFSRIERALVPVFGAKQFVRLRHAPASDEKGS
ncbi:MAG TPA: nitroreductase family deazaflavin-dependent oxidoreductase [Ktedonobacterales bacterium]|jgi:deazaflavin-dependent oxidoreductase (nitroreductase family)